MLLRIQNVQFSCQSLYVCLLTRTAFTDRLTRGQQIQEREKERMTEKKRKKEGEEDTDITCVKKVNVLVIDQLHFPPLTTCARKLSDKSKCQKISFLTGGKHRYLLTTSIIMSQYIS